MTDKLKQDFFRLTKLREDAIARGYIALATAYGWSAIRIGQQLVELQETKRLSEG